MNKGAGREVFRAALYMPSGGGDQTKKKDRTQVLRLKKKPWAYAGSEGAWSPPESPKTSTKMLGRVWLGRRLRRTWLAMQREFETLPGQKEKASSTGCKNEKTKVEAAKVEAASKRPQPSAK